MSRAPRRSTPDPAGRLRDTAQHSSHQSTYATAGRPAGTNPAIDLSIHLHEPLKTFLRQAVEQGCSLPQSWSMLEETMDLPLPAKAAVTTGRKAA